MSEDCLNRWTSLLSVSSLDLVLVDAGDCLEISHSAAACTFAVLHLEGPAVWVIYEVHFLSLAAGYPHAEQVCFCLW
jgi:hypothetical protein